MRADRLRSLRTAAALAVTATLGLLTFGPAQAAGAATYVPINGSGSTYAFTALDQWGRDLVSQGLHITYNPNGSAQGRQQWLLGQTDYGGSDIAFLTKGDPDPFGGVDANSISVAYSYIPDVAGGLSFLYNLTVDGRKITNMRLSGRTLAGIFTGHIKNWDDPAITHDYGAQLPSVPITVVTRSDGAGESYFLTRWMWREYSSLWQPFCKAMGGPSNCGPTEFFPGGPAGFKSLNGSDLVTNYVAAPANNGSIGYAEYSYAKQTGLPVVNMLNAAGYYVGPSASDVAIALEKAQIDENQNDVNFLMQNLDEVYGDKDPRAYPLSSYSYLIVPRTSRTVGGTTYGPPSEFNNSKGQTLSTYVNYILCQAQQTAGDLGYSPLPKPMVQGGFLQDGHIPGAVKSPAASNYGNCNNPAYHNGVDVLTATAPYPSPCQKAGAPVNCAVRNGRAVPASGSGGPGSNGPGSGRSGPGGSKSAGPNASASAGPGGTTIDPNTGQVLSGAAATDANVYAQTVGLASRPAGQWTFGVLTALELLAVVVVPVVLGTWLQRRRRTS